ncbi:Putative glycoside hydrolase superfamily, asl1-like, glycosyl hydrolase catalytic [Colletotrichum destructivum]|uniref:Glycoside hydrolase superfamily, asl1-like, glycosyl hydrolase catalytic n=1 Tax=Colletotrichum destructivum TaxID=34406 RepID=A0AAX4IBL6_9PEZI|nr:Putative glycoside hydrolase superfamily, asl1-like, glycosyl hydrolase catalytic [Colletotrichum destructivum]
MSRQHAQKRCLLWDYTNTRDRPKAIDQLFPPTSTASPFRSVHNWNAWYPPELKGRLPFRPMIRTRAQLDTEEWDWIRDSDAAVVHYLNEPERQGISPQDAATWWRAKVVPELRDAKGKKLVGPACASDEAGGRWLAEFMSIVCSGGSGCEGPDFLGAHYYGGDVGHAKQYIESLWERYQLPLNVSEIASTSRDKAEVVRFTEEMSSWMDEQVWVDEYGWFGCMAHCADDFVSPAAQLMDEEGKFTPLMRQLMGQRQTCERGRE